MNQLFDKFFDRDELGAYPRAWIGWAAGFGIGLLLIVAAFTQSIENRNTAALERQAAAAYHPPTVQQMNPQIYAPSPTTAPSPVISP